MRRIEPAELLGVYLQDHYAGATAGTALFRRATEHHRDPEIRRQLRLKPNGDLLRRTPLTDVVELEALRIALAGKAAGWRLLRTLAEQDLRLDARQLDRLLAGVSGQIEVVEKLRIDTARRTFTRTE